MKIFKERQHALINRPVVLQQQNLLCVGIMLYFDLQQPDRLLNEQDLWQDLPPLLVDMPLDAGWAKPRAEFLISGHSHAPNGQHCPAQEVGVQVGEVAKRLNVFGQRSWQRDRLGGWTISNPQPYRAMPLDWGHAYGGSTCEANPLGMGAPVKGEPVEGRPLPCVEAPDQLMVAPEQKVVPVGFGPLQPHWPQRRMLSGTYDQSWVETAWPDFPADLKPDFFMTASADQWLPGYFQGNETIVLFHFHPEKRRIDSRLPSPRIRAFFTRCTQADDKDLSQAEFFEPRLRADTLWLFPDLLRGVLIYRAVITCADDTYSDLARLLVVTEAAGSEPQSLAHYHRLQQSKADLNVHSQQEIRKQIRDKLSVGAIKVRNLPKTIQRMQFAQEKPVLVNTPQQTRAIFEQHLQDMEATINRIQAKTTPLHGQFGHLATIPLDRFDAAREQVNRFKTMLGRMTNLERELDEEKAQALGQAREKLRARLAPEQLNTAGIDLEQLGEQALSLFHRQLFPVACDACRQLRHFDKMARKALEASGLPADQQDHYWLGRLDQPYGFSVPAAGLTPDQANGCPEVCEIPAGWLLPRFNGAELVSLSAWQWEEARGFSPLLHLEKAPQPAWFLPAAIDSGIILWVEDPFSALLVETLMGDFVHIACFPDEKEAVADAVAALLTEDGEGAKRFHFCFQTAEMDAMARHKRQQTVTSLSWIDLHRYATLFQARADGEDLREQVLQALPPAIARFHRLILAAEQEDGAEGLTIEAVMKPEGIQAQIQKGYDQGRQAMEERMAAVLRQKNEALSRAEKHAATQGIDLAPHLAKAREQATAADIPLTRRFEAAAQQLEQKKALLARQGHLTDDIARQLDEAMVQLRSEGPKWQAKEEQLNAMAPSPEIKAAFARHGLDPDKLKPLTPETLQQRLGEKDLKQATLNGLDLRGVDFSGLDLDRTRFSQCQLQGATFAGCRIHFSQFSDCRMEETDFSEARLEQVVVKNCLLGKSLWHKAQSRLSIWQKCDAGGADFSSGLHENGTWQKSILTAALFNQARLSLCMLAKADASGLQAVQTRFEKCVCKELVLDEACFDGMHTQALLFHGCRGEQVSCRGAQLFKLRFNHDSAFPGLNLNGSVWQQGYSRNSNLDALDARGGRIEESMFDGVQLRRAQFNGVALNGCRFLKCDLEQANMQGCNLFQGSLRKSRLVATDLSDSNLYGVDFRQAVVGKTRLDRANLTRSLLQGKQDLVP